MPRPSNLLPSKECAEAQVKGDGKETEMGVLGKGARLKFPWRWHPICFLI